MNKESILLLLILLCSFACYANSIPDWSSTVPSYDSGSIVRYKKESADLFYRDSIWKAVRSVYQNTPPLKSDNGWFWIPNTADSLQWIPSYSYTQGDTVEYHDTVWEATRNVSPHTPPSLNSGVWRAITDIPKIEISGVINSATYSRYEALEVEVEVYSVNALNSSPVFELNGTALAVTSLVKTPDHHLIYTLPEITRSNNGQTGSNVLTISVTDNLGNSSSKSITFEIDDKEITPYTSNIKDDLFLLDKNNRISCHTSNLHYNQSGNQWIESGHQFSRRAQWFGSEANITTLQAGDVDGDGLSDIGMLSASGELVIRTINGATIGSSTYADGQFLTRQQIVAIGVLDFCFGDFNRDGLDDIAILTSDNKVTLYESQCDVTSIDFSSKIIEYSGSNISNIEAGDFNADGFDDILISSPGSLLFLPIDPNNNSLWLDKNSLLHEIVWDDLVVGDYTGDGVDDVAVLQGTSINILETAFSFSNKVSSVVASRKIADYSTASTPLSIASGDFNGDMLCDIAIAFDNTIEVHITTAVISDNNEIVNLDFQKTGEFNLLNQEASTFTAGQFGPVTERSFFSSTYERSLQERFTGNDNSVQETDGFLTSKTTIVTDKKLNKTIKKGKGKWAHDLVAGSISKIPFDEDRLVEINKSDYHGWISSIFNASLYEKYTLPTSNVVKDAISQIAEEYLAYPITSKEKEFTIIDASIGEIKCGWLRFHNDNVFKVHIGYVKNKIPSALLPLVGLKDFSYRKYSDTSYQISNGSSPVDLSVIKNNYPIADFRLIPVTNDDGKFTEQTLDEGVLTFNISMAYDLLKDKFSKEERINVQTKVLRPAVDSVLITRSRVGSNWQDAINAGLISCGLVLHEPRYVAMGARGCDLYIHDDRDRDNHQYSISGMSNGYWSGFAEQMGELKATRQNYIEFDPISKFTLDQSLAYQDYAISLLVSSLTAMNLGNYHFYNGVTNTNTPFLSFETFRPLLNTYAKLKMPGSEINLSHFSDRKINFSSFGDGVKGEGIDDSHFFFIHNELTKNGTDQDRFTHLFRKGRGDLWMNAKTRYEFLFDFHAFQDFFDATKHSTSSQAIEPIESITSQKLGGETGIAIYRSVSKNSGFSTEEQIMLVVPYNTVRKGVAHGHCDVLSPTLIKKGIAWFSDHSLPNTEYDIDKGHYKRSSFGHNALFINGFAARHNNSGTPPSGVVSGSLESDLLDVNENFLQLKTNNHYDMSGNNGGGDVSIIRKFYIDPDGQFILDAIDIVPIGSSSLKNFDMLYHFPIDATVTVSSGSTITEFRSPNSIKAMKIKTKDSADKDIPLSLGTFLTNISGYSVNNSSQIKVETPSGSIFGFPVHGLEFLVEADTDMGDASYDHPILLSQSKSGSPLHEGFDAIWIWNLDPYDASSNTAGLQLSSADIDYDPVEGTVTVGTATVDLHNNTYLKKNNKEFGNLIPILIEE